MKIIVPLEDTTAQNALRIAQTLKAQSCKIRYNPILSNGNKCHVLHSDLNHAGISTTILTDDYNEGAEFEIDTVFTLETVESLVEEMEIDFEIIH